MHAGNVEFRKFGHIENLGFGVVVNILTIVLQLP